MSKSASKARRAETIRSLVKRNVRAPALELRSGEIFIKAGTQFQSTSFKRDVNVPMPKELAPGSDYGVFILRGQPVLKALEFATGKRLPPTLLGGFHFAPGGNAGREGKGGSETPAINRYSLWDRNFRPACPDPRGMALVKTPGGNFWCDIYLCNADHLAGGTSRLGAPIADGQSSPDNPAGGKFKRFDYAAATSVMTWHGKTLLSPDEFFAATFGVTEKTAHSGDPVTAKLDAPRTSVFGIMQATGNLWVWGHCGHPTMPRASIFGGSWLYAGNAGSRDAHVAYYWPGLSDESVGARGRSDHLQLG